MKKVYKEKELYLEGEPPKYSSDCTQAAFLLGGIGTGNFSIGARGELRDWEIFNRPAKGGKLPHTFFSLYLKEENKEPITKVLEAQMQPPFDVGLGIPSDVMAGLPRLKSSQMHSKYPFVWVDFEDDRLPVDIKLEAFTPFIPLNADDSGIPGAIIRYKVKNNTQSPIKVSIAGSLANASTVLGYNAAGYAAFGDEIENQFNDGATVRGLCLKPSADKEESLYGNMALATTDSNITYKREWLKGGWFDGIQDYWNDFSEDGMLEPESQYDAYGNGWGTSSSKIGSLGVYKEIAPNSEETFEFILSWYFPKRLKGWESVWMDYKEVTPDTYELGFMNNYYSTQFKSAWHVAEHLANNLSELENASRCFSNAVYSSTLPTYILEALSSNITVLRSNTCFRTQDGNFYGWEGCQDTSGSCAGSCTHVWNYAQTLAFLFPKLEQSMRKIEFMQETEEDGKMNFRTYKSFGENKWDMLAAVDGQMGTLVRLYRDWKISGDDSLITDMYDNVVKALEYALTEWDKDGDNVLEGKMHNTYDIEFYGVSSLSNSAFFAALKAVSEMADFMNDSDRANKYRTILEDGSHKMDQLLFNGDYYVQDIDDVNGYRYQYGIGCLSDQLLGQYLAHVAGLSYVLPEDHVKKAIHAVFEHNFKSSLEDHNNAQRTYALNDEKGLLLCSWPNGGRPRLPFVYSDEVWTGIEYQVAAHLIYEGFVDEGLTIVKGLRERFDGVRRNPWNEYECGHHYARSMASWALLTALSGFSYDMGNSTISFDPKVNKEDFKAFWCVGDAWGTYTQQIDPNTNDKKTSIEILYSTKADIDIKCN